MNKPKTPKMVMTVLVVAFIASLLFYAHAQAIYHKQIRYIQEQINYMHNHPGKFLPTTNTDKP
jgi:hypothetical protein